MDGWIGFLALDFFPLPSIEAALGFRPLLGLFMFMFMVLFMLSVLRSAWLISKSVVTLSMCV